MKKLLAIITSLAVVLAMMPSMAFAGTDGAVAKIGEDYYADLATAINAVEAGGTITLLEDFTVENNSIEKDRGHYNISKPITIDGNGKTITAQNFKYESDKSIGHLFNIENITDGNVKFQNLNIEGGNNAPRHGINTFKAKGVVIENVTIKGMFGYGIVCNGSTVEVNNSATEENGWGGINVDSSNKAATNSSLIVNGGNYTEAKDTLNIEKQCDAGEINVVVNDGTFVYAGIAETYKEKKGISFTINGGTFSSDPTDYVNNTAARVVVDGEKYKVVSDAKINEVKYPTLEAAITAAHDDETITLLEDFTIENNSIEKDRGHYNISKSITIDGNGKTITAQNFKYESDKSIGHLFNIENITDGNVKFQNLNIEGGNNAPRHGINTFKAKGVVIENVTIKGMFGYGIVCNGSTVEVNNSATERNGWGGINVDSSNKAATNSSLIVNGGNYTEAKDTLNIEKQCDAGEINVVVNDGTFVYAGIAETYKEKKGISFTINGGTFSSDPKAYVAEGTKIYLKGLQYYVGEAPTHSSGMNSWALRDDGIYTEYLYIAPSAPPAPPADPITNDGGNTAAGEAPSTTLDAKPVTTTTDGVKTTTGTVDAATGEKLVEKAVANKSEEVVVDVTTSNANASSAAEAKTEVTLPEATVKAIADQTTASVDIKTDNAVVSLDNEAVKEVAKQAGTTGEVKLVVETVKADDNEVRIEVKLETSNGAVTNFGAGNVKVTVPVTPALKGKTVVCVYIDDNGNYTKMEGMLNADGTYTFVTNHFSTYAIMEEAEADKVIAKQRADELNTLIKEVKFKASTKYTSKKNVKVTAKVTAGDISAITDMGYTVKYKFYRAEKKSSRYALKATKATDTYTNTAGKKGKKYYYKVRLAVYDGDTLVGESELKQSEYGVRTWKK